ncbi:hypothetical protein RUND412_010193 [Rhizina undulata]
MRTFSLSPLRPFPYPRFSHDWVLHPECLYKKFSPQGTLVLSPFDRWRIEKWLDMGMPLVVNWFENHQSTYRLNVLLWNGIGTNPEKLRALIERACPKKKKKSAILNLEEKPVVDKLVEDKSVEDKLVEDLDKVLHDREVALFGVSPYFASDIPGLASRMAGQMRGARSIEKEVEEDVVTHSSPMMSQRLLRPLTGEKPVRFKNNVFNLLISPFFDRSMSELEFSLANITLTLSTSSDRFVASDVAEGGRPSTQIILKRSSIPASGDVERMVKRRRISEESDRAGEDFCAGTRESGGIFGAATIGAGTPRNGSFRARTPRRRSLRVKNMGPEVKALETEELWVEVLESEPIEVGVLAASATTIARSLKRSSSPLSADEEEHALKRRRIGEELKRAEVVEQEISEQLAMEQEFLANEHPAEQDVGTGPKPDQPHGEAIPHIQLKNVPPKEAEEISPDFEGEERQQDDNLETYYEAQEILRQEELLQEDEEVEVYFQAEEIQGTEVMTFSDQEKSKGLAILDEPTIAPEINEPFEELHPNDVGAESISEREKGENNERLEESNQLLVDVKNFQQSEIVTFSEENKNQDAVDFEEPTIEPEIKEALEEPNPFIVEGENATGQAETEISDLSIPPTGSNKSEDTTETTPATPIILNAPRKRRALSVVTAASTRSRRQIPAPSISTPTPVVQPTRKRATTPSTTKKPAVQTSKKRAALASIPETSANETPEPLITPNIAPPPATPTTTRRRQVPVVITAASTRSRRQIAVAATSPTPMTQPTRKRVTTKTPAKKSKTGK